MAVRSVAQVQTQADRGTDREIDERMRIGTAARRLIRAWSVFRNVE